MWAYGRTGKGPKCVHRLHRFPSLNNNVMARKQPNSNRLGVQGRNGKKIEKIDVRQGDARKDGRGDGNKRR